jgi:cyanophycin synthetase
VANALAATAALWACGYDRERIVNALTSFRSTVERNPLRFNVFTARGVHIVLDYAHNAASYEALIDTARGLATRRVVGVVTAPGDRRDEKLREIGGICGRGFDELLVYEMDDRRGRQAGETAAQLALGAAAAGIEPASLEIDTDVRQAIRVALDRCQPGDLLVVGCASHVEDLVAAVPDAEELTEILPPPSEEAPMETTWLPLGTDRPLGTPRPSPYHH